MIPVTCGVAILVPATRSHFPSLLERRKREVIYARDLGERNRILMECYPDRRYYRAESTKLIEIYSETTGGAGDMISRIFSSPASARLAALIKPSISVRVKQLLRPDNMKKSSFRFIFITSTHKSLLWVIFGHRGGTLLTASSRVGDASESRHSQFASK